jgi:hypothetical protein
LFAAGVVIAGLTPAARASTPAHHGPANFGPNVVIFDPSMPTSDIQAKVDAIADQQVSNQFGSQRYALLFEPGTYGSPAEPLTFQVGYYTEVAGLGALPNDVTINGTIDVYNQCLAPDNCIALVNFWRSLANLTINIAGQTGCRSGTDFWAVSQAAPLRRVDVQGGNLSLMDYCSAGPQYASGGFIADSTFSGGTVINGSQQQFLVRNSTLDGWTNAVWNQVFSGVQGAPAQSFPDPPYTTLATSPLTRERPYLYRDSQGGYRVFAPATQRNSSGPARTLTGRSIPLDRFFVATPSDSATRINAALAGGQNLLLTPGVYALDRTLVVRRADTVVLGLGFATLVPQHGVVAMRVADVAGVQLAGLLFDAGPVRSPVLLQVGDGGGHRSDPRDPTSLSDVFFRIGGAGPGQATNSLVVNSDNVLLDHIWAWRADHGSGVGWTQNTADTGVIVNGDNVTAYGLFVEHYQKYEVIWKGENGKTIMFQNEMPYDPPNQAAWRANALGYAAYQVAPSVHTHQAWGLGSYCFFNVDPTIHASHAFEVPTRSGVQLHDLLTISLNGDGVIDHVVNDTGAPTPVPNTVPSFLLSYP